MDVCVRAHSRGVRSESSASERCILNLEERPLSLVVDTTGDDSAICQHKESGTWLDRHLFFLEHPIPVLDILFPYA